MMFEKETLVKDYTSNKHFSFINGVWVYDGPRGGSKCKRHPIIYRSYKSWENQRRRCNSPNHNMYDHYGKKGVKVIWSAYDCINWYINEILTRDFWIKPVVSRMGDIGNYEISNCRLIEDSENLKQEDRSTMSKLLRRSVKMINVADQNDIMEFDSAKEASLFIKKNKRYIDGVINGNYLATYNNQKYTVFYTSEPIFGMNKFNNQ